MNTDQEEGIMIKGKRTKRPRPSATSSSSTAAADGGGGVTSDDVSVSDRTTASLSDSGELTHDEEEDMAHCLILLAKGQRQRMMTSPQPPPPPAAAAGEVYQCKTCSKSFSSFQALGGHRASHKKPNDKQILALGDKKEIIKQECFHQSNQRSTILSLQIPNRIARVHECSLCGAEFASGQALGGHMRRHRPIPAAAAISSRHGGESSSQEVKRERNVLLSVDLNMPAAPEEDHQPVESKFAFAPQEQVIVFSATPNLIDCHYY